MKRGPFCVRLVAFFALVALAACQSQTLPPVGHVLLYIDTDAPVPAPPGVPTDPLAPEPLFDSVQVELYPAGATSPCDACTRVFPLDTSKAAAGVSFSLVPQTAAEPVVAHVTLFRDASAQVHGIAPALSLQSWVSLPAVPAFGETVRAVFLPTSNMGTPAGSLTAPVQPDPTPTLPARFGSWAQAARTPCMGAPRAGEVCVPGGAFWSGGDAVQGGGETQAAPHIVVLSPFFLDEHEVTVAELRSGKTDFSQLGGWSGSLSGADPVNAPNDWCTYTVAPGPHETLPTNCITWSGARLYCQGVGADLPTETQLEYVMSGLQSASFPWGSGTPACADGVWGRGSVWLPDSLAPCLPRAGAGVSAQDLIGYPQAVDRPMDYRDELALTGGTLQDLFGNLSEWAQDWLQAPSESCWSAPGVLTDPVCTTPSKLVLPVTRTIKGGNFTDSAVNLVASIRDGFDPTTFTPLVGFRCARPGM